MAALQTECVLLALYAGVSGSVQEDVVHGGEAVERSDMGGWQRGVWDGWVQVDPKAFGGWRLGDVEGALDASVSRMW
jgi:hypothetical protein